MGCSTFCDGISDTEQLQGPRAPGQMGSSGVMRCRHGPRHDLPDALSGALAMCCVEGHRALFLEKHRRLRALVAELS
jgi:hypothetical protein